MVQRGGAGRTCEVGRSIYAALGSIRIEPLDRYEREGKVCLAWIGASGRHRSRPDVVRHLAGRVEAPPR
jgi:hypothetical protein